MSIFTLILITLAISTVGGYIANKLRFPAGYMVGGMVLVGAFTIFTDWTYLPSAAKVIAQTISGTFIGASISRSDCARIRKLIKPTLIMICTMVVLCIGMGLFMYTVTELDLVTALFACVPGGVADITLISMDMNADSAQVAVLHVVRLLSVIGLFPLILGPVTQRVDQMEKKRRGLVEPEEKQQASAEEIKAILKKPVEQMDRKTLFVRTALTLGVSAIGGYLGFVLNIPAGALACSMLVAACYNVTTGKGHLPKIFRTIAQVASGALIGVTITMEKILSLRYLIGPAIMLVVLYSIINLITGYLIHKNTDLDYITAVFASSPAGAMEMSFISADLGADAATVAIMQVFRLICVIMVFPTVIKVLCTLLL